MPWCPKCRNEYVEGVAACSDCGLPLVATLAQAKELNKHYAALEELQKMLPEGVDAEEVMKEQMEAARVEAVEDFFADDKEAEEEEIQILPKGRRGHQPADVFQDSKSKAAEYKSSAQALMIVGAAGLVCMAAMRLGFLPAFGLLQQPFVMLCVSVMFAGFFVGGIASLKTSKNTLAKADAETELLNKMTAYIQENFKAETFDSDHDISGEGAPEVLYFKRTEIMRNALVTIFPDAADAMVEHLIDELYPTIFEA